MATKKEETKQEFTTMLVEAQKAYMPLIAQQLQQNSIEFTPYQKKCVLNSVTFITDMLYRNGLSWGSKELEQNNITKVLYDVANLGLNPTAQPREVYFQLRNTAIKTNEGTIYKKYIEMGVEGDGNDAILNHYGRNVKKVYPYWVVREGDEFEYPKYNGIEVTPPTWTPCGTGKVLRVVYPIMDNENIITYQIAEREDCKKNLTAQIINNLMNETFGLAVDIYKATPEAKKEIKATKEKLIEEMNGLSFEELLHSEKFKQWINPNWRNPNSQESMIIRKLRNNIVKAVPKEYQEFNAPIVDEDSSKEQENIIDNYIDIDAVEQANKETEKPKVETITMDEYNNLSEEKPKTQGRQRPTI